MNGGLIKIIALCLLVLALACFGYPICAYLAAQGVPLSVLMFGFLFITGAVAYTLAFVLVFGKSWWRSA